MRLLATLRCLLALLALADCRALAPRTIRRGPITIVVPLAAGTGMDIIARLYGEQLSQRLGKPVIIENKPGAGFLIATQQVLAAPADGHTLLVAAPSNLAYNQIALQAIALRSREGPRADLALSDVAVHPGGQSGAAGPLGARVHQIRQGAVHAAELQHAGRRRRAGLCGRGDGAAVRPEVQRTCPTATARNRSWTWPPARSSSPSPRPAPRRR